MVGASASSGYGSGGSETFSGIGSSLMALTLRAATVGDQTRNPTRAVEHVNSRASDSVMGKRQGWCTTTRAAPFEGCRELHSPPPLLDHRVRGEPHARGQAPRRFTLDAEPAAARARRG